MAAEAIRSFTKCIPAAPITPRTARPLWTSLQPCRCYGSPGPTLDYGFWLDITGQIIEKLSGQTLGAYLKANLFTPLGMKDTGFYVPPEKVSRYAKPLPADPDTGAPQTRSPELTNPINFDCGGGWAD